MSVKRNFLAALALFQALSSISSQTTPAPAASASGSAATSNSSAAAPAPAGPPVCNLPLLNQLRLSGNATGTGVAIDSCGISAGDSCCSAVDEIKIIKSWNQFTLPKIKKYNNDFGLMMRKINDIVPYVQSMDNATIRYHADNLEWRKTNETRCINGKYFVEETGLDVVKLKEKVPADIVRAFAEAVGGRLGGQQTAIVASSVVVDTIKKALGDDQTAYDFSSLLGSSYLDAWVRAKATEIVTLLAALPATQIDLTGVPKGQTPVAYLLRILGLGESMSKAAAKISEEYFLTVVHSRAAVMHLTSLGTFFDDMGKALSSSLYNVKNADKIVGTIKEAIFSDEVLQKYIMWFITPRFEAPFGQMFTYTKDRILKIMTSSFLSAPEYAFNASHYGALKRAFQQMGKFELLKLLQGNYCRILGAFQVLYRLPLVVEAAWKNGPLTKPELFVQMARRSFNLTDYTDLKSPYAQCTTTEPTFKKTVTRIMGEVSPLLNYTLAYPASLKPDLAGAKTYYDNLAIFARNYTVMNYDGKPACSVFQRHVMVREAVFNPKKFEFCQASLRDFLGRNISTVLQDLVSYQEQFAEILSLKRGLYCAACSKNMSQAIKFEQGNVELSNQFCLSFVTKYSRLFTWRSTTFSSYIRSMYQYLRCFGSGAKLNQTFPFEDRDQIIPQSIPGLESCLSVKSAADIAKCTSFCGQFRVGTFASNLDGDSKQLRRLYNFIIDVLRVTGRRFGQMPTSSSKGRQLEEEPEWVRNLAHTSRPRKSRRLQQTAPPAGTTGGATTPATPTGTTSGTSSTTPATGSTGAAAAAPKQFTGAESTNMYLYLAQSLDKMTTYTRGDHYNHDELASARLNYKPVVAGTLIRNLTCSLKPQGIDLMEASRKANFDIGGLQSLQYKNLVVGSEQLSPYAIRDCVQVTAKDVTAMASDISLNIAMTLPQTKPQPKLTTYDERKFAKYRPKGPDAFGRKLKRTRRAERRLRQKKSLAQRRATATLRDRRPKQSGNSITNFLFKLLF